MKAFKAFNISHVGLQEGQHRFDYTIDKKFLALFENALIKDANVQVTLTLDKQPGFLSLHFEWSGSIPSICDICMEDFDLAVAGTEDVIVKFVVDLPEDNMESDIIYKQLGENSINVALTLYEALILNIPIRKVHPENKNGVPSCDPKILALLETTIGAENEEEEEESSGNSIWDELKKLKPKD